MSQIPLSKLEETRDVLHQLFAEMWKAGDVDTARKYAKAHDEISMRISKTKKIGAIQAQGQLSKS